MNFVMTPGRICPRLPTSPTRAAGRKAFGARPSGRFNVQTAERVEKAGRIQPDARCRAPAAGPAKTSPRRFPRWPSSKPENHHTNPTQMLYDLQNMKSTHYFSSKSGVQNRLHLHRASAMAILPASFNPARIQAPPATQVKAGRQLRLCTPLHPFAQQSFFPVLKKMTLK